MPVCCLLLRLDTLKKLSIIKKRYGAVAQLGERMVRNH